jgi:phosphopantothenoylcysteine decarboxylase/phosphopantothenate--cysteine ligase
VLTPVATVDVVRELVALRRRGQLVVAFAAETTDLAANAQRKLKEKDVDLLVANDVTAPEAGFSHPTNEVVLMGRDGSVQELSLRSKESVAEAILTKVASLFTQGVS